MMLGADGLTARTSTFDRRDVLRGWCQHLPHGANVADVERLADRLLSISDVRVITEAGNPLEGRPGAVRSLRRHSTAELLALEAWVLETAAGQARAGRAVVPEPAVRTGAGRVPGAVRGAARPRQPAHPLPRRGAGGGREGRDREDHRASRGRDRLAERRASSARLSVLRCVSCDSSQPNTRTIIR